MPKVAIVPTQTPNAFATGRNPKHAVVAVTQGILSLLSEDELRGVLAHEISHVGNRDILVMSVAATLAGAISFMARMFGWNMLLGGGSRDRNGNAITVILALVGMLLAPIAALLVQLAISRSREYKADYSGAKTVGQPLALASALEKLEIANRRRPLVEGVESEKMAKHLLEAGMRVVEAEPDAVPRIDVHLLQELLVEDACFLQDAALLRDVVLQLRHGAQRDTHRST